MCIDMPSEPERAALPSELLELVPRLSPGFDPPWHLAAIAEQLDRSLVEPVRVVIATPPQHGKTTLIKTGLVQRLLRGDRTRRSAFVTYNQDKADDESRAAQLMADEAGLVWGGKLDLWGAGGSHVRWTSIGGKLTGYPVDDLLIIDDPVKDWVEAESARQRDRVWAWWQSVAKTRLHPTASVIVVATRWHRDDLSGRLVDGGWQYINLQAIDDVTGEILWPQKRTREWYEEVKADTVANVWAGMWQGRPQPRGAGVFGPPHFYRELPKHFIRGYGVDLAYTRKTRADRSVLIEMLREDRDAEKKPRFYLKHALVEQCEAPAFAARLRNRQASAPADMLFLCAGTELGGAQFIEKEVPGFRTETAKYDKLVRARDLAVAWNDGRVLVPDPEVFEEPWLADVLNVFDSFTGEDGQRDDEVDAAAAAHRVLETRFGNPLDAYK